MAARTEAAWWDVAAESGVEARGGVYVVRSGGGAFTVYADLGDGPAETGRIIREGAGWDCSGRRFRSVRQAVLEEARLCLHSQLVTIRSTQEHGPVKGALVQAATPSACGHTISEIYVDPYSDWPTM